VDAYHIDKIKLTYYKRLFEDSILLSAAYQASSTPFFVFAKTDISKRNGLIKLIVHSDQAQ
jgi:hypothetical protein